MRVLLVCPSYKHRDTSPPLGLLYVASVLEENGHDVKVIDFGVDKSSNFGLLVKKSDILGISFTSQQLREAHKLAIRAKSISPKIKVVVGGPHSTIFEEKVFEEIPGVDYIVVGEGENTALELANERETEKIKGLIWRDNDGKVYVNQPRPLIKNLDKIPFPARHLVPIKRYSCQGAILTSRGCPFRCIYCFKIAGRVYRAHSPEYVLSEMDEMKRNYDIKEFFICDDNFVANPARASEIADGLIDRNWGSKITLWGGIRVDSVAHNEGLIAKLAKAGLRSVGLGVESIIQEVLDAAKKDTICEEIDKAINILKKYNVSFFVFLMVGLPGDKYEFVKATKNWVTKNRIKEFGVSLATPYPKTELWNYVNEHGRWLIQPNKTGADYPWHTVGSVYSMWDTPDFPAKQRMKAVVELMRFSAVRMGFISRERLSLAIKNSRLLLWWFTKWLRLSIADWMGASNEGEG